ncbi:hypothetical protein [Hymenobacter sp. B81]|uniref:hypothetical protein n=1 Tax=Hymenobacter sp. B81 TaxID=3344878 RepID=UPI0037DC5FC4
MKKDQRSPLTAYLLGAALLLSAGLNGYLLLPSANYLTGPDLTEAARVAESELELRLAHSQLARCQAEQLRKDSLLVSLLSRTHSLSTGL